MTDKEQKALRSYCASLQEVYGFDFAPDNPAAPVLYIFHKELELLHQNNRALASQVENAASRINPQVFNFYYKGEAWKFQMGIAIKWVLWVGLALLSIWGAAWYWSTTNDVDYARIVTGSSDNVSELMKRATKDKEGSYFLYFRAAKGNSAQPFVEYERVDANTVRVRLGKKAESSKP